MDFNGIKEIAIYGICCMVDVSRGDDDVCRILTAKERLFDIKVSDAALTVTQKSLNFFSRLLAHRIELKAILPKYFKGRLRFRNKNGGCYISGCDFSELELTTANGKFDLVDVSTGGMLIKTENGVIRIKNLLSTAAVNVKCANGNIKAESVCAQEIALSCRNAAVSAVDITAKEFMCQTSNGTIDADAVKSDEIRLETSNGKVNASVVGTRDDYKIFADTAHGGLTVNGEAYKRLADSTHAPKKITVKVPNGDIDIRFI